MSYGVTLVAWPPLSLRQTNFGSGCCGVRFATVLHYVPHQALRIPHARFTSLRAQQSLLWNVIPVERSEYRYPWKLWWSRFYEITPYFQSPKPKVSIGRSNLLRSSSHWRGLNDHFQIVKSSHFQIITIRSPVHTIAPPTLFLTLVSKEVQQWILI